MSPNVVVKCVPRFDSKWTVKEVSVAERDCPLAEDVIISLSQDLKINPISRHLLALYDPHSKLWLSPNENLIQWLSETQGHALELRVRFKPADLNALKRNQAAFDYYFFQIRNDFRNKKHSDTKTQPEVLGLSIADIICFVMDKYPHLTSSEAVKALDDIVLKDFIPLPLLERLKVVLSAKATEFREKMLIAWRNSNQDANMPKQEYIRTLLDGLADNDKEVSSPIWPEYHVEQYSAQLDVPYQQVLIDFQPLTQEIRVRQKLNTGSNWGRMCSIEELCSIGVQLSAKTVEVSRRNGISIPVRFNSLAELKSFVSLLDGYYRLSQKWSFSLCKDVSLPSLPRLKSLKCHGPVGAGFAAQKLKDKAGDRCGTYIMRESGKNFSEYIVDVCFGRLKAPKHLNVNESEAGFTCALGTESYPTMSELLSQLVLTNEDGLNFSLGFCIPPSECDNCDRLRMCRLKSESEKAVSAQNSSPVPVVFPAQAVSFPDAPLMSRGNQYKVTVCRLNNCSVVVKEAKREESTVSFLKTVNDWIHLKSDCLVSMKGVILYPPALVLDHYPLGPLDRFLAAQRDLKPVDLVEAATYCARALWYLEEKKLVHGAIRCRNLLVSAYTPSSLKVKLCDPLSHRDVKMDALWISPEERDSALPTAAGDVWAFGSTLWEIFCYGKTQSLLSRPDTRPDDVFDLVQPIGCSAEVWDLVQDCWKTAPEERKQPQGIVRDINQILYEVYNSRRTNCYSIVSETRAEKSGRKFVRSLFGSSGNLSLRSSIMSTSTLLTGLDSSSSDLISLYSRDPDEAVSPPFNESWIIEANQLSLEAGKILGQGCYGEVVKAVLTKWCGLETEVVAVKRINQNIPTDSGLKDMRREIEIMKKLSHRNIVEIKGFVEDPQLMLVMEYMELGSLVSYLKVHKNRMLEHGLNKLPLKNFALNIIAGMKYLESRKIVHRDLAARNILVASDSEVKISDFGLAQVIREGDYYRMRTQRGLPLRWYAPESIMRGTFTHKSDVWSFGVTLWEMYSFGKDPRYPECPDDSKLLQKLEEGKRLECPEDCPLEVYEIMRSCWKTSSEERPSFTRLELDVKGTSD